MNIPSLQPKSNLTLNLIYLRTGVIPNVCKIGKALLERGDIQTTNKHNCTTFYPKRILYVRIHINIILQPATCPLCDGSHHLHFIQEHIIQHQRFTNTDITSFYDELFGTNPTRLIFHFILQILVVIANIVKQQKQINKARNLLAGFMNFSKDSGTTQSPILFQKCLLPVQLNFLLYVYKFCELQSSFSKTKEKYITYSI